MKPNDSVERGQRAWRLNDLLDQTRQRTVGVEVLDEGEDQAG